MYGLYMEMCHETSLTDPYVDRTRERSRVPELAYKAGVG